MTRLIVTSKAIKDLRRRGAQDSERVIGALKRYASTRQGDVKKLTDVDPTEWRLRVGDLRARFTYDPQRDEIVVLRVLPRDKAY